MRCSKISNISDLEHGYSLDLLRQVKFCTINYDDVTIQGMISSSSKTLNTRNAPYKTNIAPPITFVIFHFDAAIVIITVSNIAKSNRIEHTSPLLSTLIGSPRYIAE